MDADLILKTVQNYLKVLEEHPSPLVDASRLPSSKETLKRSIQTLWFTLEQPEIRSSLKIAFLCLANFQVGISSEFEDLFQTCQHKATADEVSIEARFCRLAEEKFPEEFGWLTVLREDEIKALNKEITLWENDDFE